MEPPKLHDDLCGSAHTASITVGVAGLESAVVLRATKHHIDHDFNCTVNVTTRVDRSLLYSISFLDLPMTCLSYLECRCGRTDGTRNASAETWTTLAARRHTG